MVIEMTEQAQPTETNRSRPALDLLDTEQAVLAVLAGQSQVAAAVQAAHREIARAVELLTAAYQAGGRLLLLGAGTSGRLAVQEAVEVPGTYGVAEHRIQARVAGGGAGHLVGTDAAEDDVALGRSDIGELAVQPVDAVILVTASGRTPYTCAAAERAGELGARLVGVINQAGSPLAELVEVAIEVPVGAEVVAGSTRLAAGSAQKLVLNTLTTATMIRLGRVHDNHMIDVVAANDKLRRRVAAAVAASTGADDERSWQAMQRCDWNARAAIVHLATGLAPAAAAELAAAHRTVREAIRAAQG